MGGDVQIPLWLMMVGGGGALLLLVLAILLWVRSRARKGRRRALAERASELLEEAVRRQFPSMDQLLGDLRGLGDGRAVETALLGCIDGAKSSDRARLLDVYAALGLRELHLSRLSGQATWSEQSDAAHALGRLQVVEAIPHLVRLASDPGISDGVRMAASQALAEMGRPEALPALIAEWSGAHEAVLPHIAQALEAIGEPAVASAIEASRRGVDIETRVRAIQFLATTGRPEALPALLSGLRDRAEPVRLAAADALGELGATEGVRRLVETALRDPEGSVRERAATALRQIGETASLPALVKGLDDDDYLIRVRTVEAVEHLEPRDVSVLARALRDTSSEVRRRSAEALVRIAPLKECVEALEGDPAVAEQARHILTEVGRAGQLEALLPFLEHEDFHARIHLIELLGELGDRRVLTALAGCLEDPVAPVRTAAVRAIAKLGPKRWLGVLRPALTDSDELVQAAAIRALQTLGLPNEVDDQRRLVELFYAGGPLLRAAVVELTGDLDLPEVEPMLEEGLRDVDAGVRVQATQAVAERASERWFDALLERLDDSSTPARAAAARGLGRLGTVSALTWLFRHMETPDTELREALSDALATYGPKALAAAAGRSQTREYTLALVWALGKTKHPDAVPQLIDLAGHDDEVVRAAVAGALGKHTGAAPAAGALVDLLSDLNERVRAAAANALGKLKGGNELVSDLVAALSDPDLFVRNRVALAMGRLGGELAVEALTYALERSAELDEIGYLVIGLVLEGSPGALRAAVPRLEAERLKGRIKRLLDKEDESIRVLFRRHIRLEQERQDEDRGTGLTAGDLVSNYVSTLLNSQYVSARTSAVSALRSLGVEPFKSLLFDAVRTDPAPEVRLTAVRALSDLTDDSDVKALCVEALGDRDVRVQLEAAHALAPARDASQMEALLRALMTPHPELERAVVASLVATRPEDLSTLLRTIGRIHDVRVLRGAASALRSIGDDQATALVCGWLDDPSEELRAEAASTLGQFDSPKAREGLLRCLSDASRLVRQTALDAIPNLLDESTLAAVRPLCDDPAIPVRLALARLAGRGPYPTGVDITERLCWDNDRSVRIQALTGLLFGRQRESLERFVVISRRQPDRVRSALRLLGSVRLAVAKLQQMAWKQRDPSMRAAAIRALAELGEEPRDNLLGALQSDEPEVVVAAVEVLQDVADPEVEEALRTLRDHEDTAVREAVSPEREREREQRTPNVTPPAGWEIIRRPARSNK